MDPEGDPFFQLTVDQLVQILSYVDINERMSSCSLVSSTWRTAAARATTSIDLGAIVSIFGCKDIPSFQHWLMSHTTEVQVTSLAVLGAGMSSASCWRPVAVTS
jgi:hypothetical protein